MRRFARFAMAGGMGFAVDAGVLALLLHATGLGPYFARLIAIAAALFVTWQINRNVAFTPSSRHVAVEGGRYGGVGLATAFFNYLAYSGMVWLMPQIPPLLALAVASLAAMGLTYAGYSCLVFDR